MSAPCVYVYVCTHVHSVPQSQDHTGGQGRRGSTLQGVCAHVATSRSAVGDGAAGLSKRHTLAITTLPPAPPGLHRCEVMCVPAERPGDVDGAPALAAAGSESSEDGWGVTM